MTDNNETLELLRDAINQFYRVATILDKMIKRLTNRVENLEAAVAILIDEKEADHD